MAENNKKYDWETWFAQGRVVIRRGVDYFCTQSSMASQVRNAASRRGIRVRLIDNDNSFAIEAVDERENLAEDSVATGTRAGVDTLPHA